MKKYSIKTSDFEMLPVDSEVDSIWKIKWEIKERPSSKKNELKVIGYIWFEGEPERGTLSMDFQVEPDFKMSPYIKEALKAMIEWCFAYRNIYEIKVNSPRGDYYRTDAIERAGFVFRIGDKVIENYSIVKPKTIWLGLYIVIGLVAGFLIGILFESLVIGMGLGILVGILMGSVLDTKAYRARVEVTGQAETKKGWKRK